MQDFASLHTLFESYMAAHLPAGTPDSLYEPMRYVNAMQGKRIRPVLLLMAYNLWHEDVTEALPAALAVEYFHNFSLVHDDIMDEAALRRGQEAVHVKFGRNVALLSGDALLIKCFEWLLEAGERNNKGAALCDIMAKAALTICEGQQMDMDFEHGLIPSENEYLEMIRRKTACLVGVSLKLGAMLADGPASDAEALYDFGERTGMAFQVQDDILDTFGDSEETGKPQGQDIIRGKKNFMFVRTWGQLNGIQRDEFLPIHESAGKNGIGSVLKYYEERDVKKYGIELQEAYTIEAMKRLGEIRGVDVKALKEMAEGLVNRKK